MRVAITGASGNVGTALLRLLRASVPDVEIVGVCRRPPDPVGPSGGVSWVACDLGAPTAAATLRTAFEGADAVVHLAWAIQPERRPEVLRAVNLGGTQAVLTAAGDARVRHLVHASSVGVYAPGEGAPVTEQWPTTGIATSTYSRHKVRAERLVDSFEDRHPEVTVTRLRPTLIMQREAATEISRLFLGPLVPPAAIRLVRRRIPVLPLPAGLALQFVHADDVADATVRILQRRAGGAFNLAAEVLADDLLADLLAARPIPVPPQVLRVGVGVLYGLRAIPVSPGWFDLAVQAPLLNAERARDALDWVPVRSSVSAAGELIDGLAAGARGSSPVLT
jgi:nucleoside-diphosphate-sugar epimerase